MIQKGRSHDDDHEIKMAHHAFRLPAGISCSAIILKAEGKEIDENKSGQQWVVRKRN